MGAFSLIVVINLLNRFRMLNFSQHIFYFLQPGFSKQRLDIFDKQITKYNGIVNSQLDNKTTLVIVNAESKHEHIWVKKLSTLDKERLYQLKIVNSNWISSCLKNKNLVPNENYVVQLDACHARATKKESETRSE